MNLTQAKEHYKSVIKQLILEKNFGDFLFENRTQNGFIGWYNAHEDLFTDTFYITHGMTKVVIIDKTTDFVVKIPFCDCRLNYCEEELAVYLSASDHSVEGVFAWCDKFFSYEKDSEFVNFYIMEYVEVNEEKMSNFIRKNYPAIAEDYSVSKYTIDEDVVFELFRQLLGEDSYNMVRDFIDEEGINDLHGGNVGWNRKGELVLCDYSGFVG